MITDSRVPVLGQRSNDNVEVPALDSVFDTPDDLTGLRLRGGSNVRQYNPQGQRVNLRNIR
jgi:hypothetical protein